MDKTKSWLASILRIDRFSCCKQNTHLNICSNFMDYIHSSRRRKQILLVILIISILLLIIVIITMVVLYNQYDESLTTIYGTSSSYSSSEVLMPPVNKLSPMKKTHHPPVLSSIHLPTTYTTDSSSSISNSKTEQQKCKTQKFCLNVSCLQIASIFAERLGRYNRPKSLVNLLDKCSPEQIDEIIKIFYIGDEFHLSNNENSLYRFKQKRLFTLWSYVSDQLQSYVIEDKSRPFLLWTEKLAYLFQNMIDQYMFKRNLTDNMTDNQTGNNPNGQDYEKLLLNSSKHTLNHQSDSNKVTEVNNTSLMYTSVVPKVGTTVPFPFFASTYTVSATKTQEFNEFDNMAMSFHTELEQLNALLQMGNIAFHGLDNVLINVQLHLRVPLFFTAWIARSHTPGLMDSLIPMLENCEQLELPGYEELKKFIPIDSASYPTTSPPSSSSFQPPPLFPSSFSISSSPSFLWNRVHELQNYIHHLGQLAWKARYSHITKRNTTDEVKSLNLSGVLPVLYKIQKLNHLDDQKPVKSQKMTLRDLMQITQHTINFPRYLGKLTSWNHVNVMPRDMQVWVTNVDYYEELGHILQQTSFSELQDYITFAILHKYGGFVDQQIAQLKRKLLKPYAESLGIEQVSYWPFLLDMASPGLKLILQSRWNLGQLNHAVKQFHVEILTPVQALFAKLLNNSMSDTTKCHELSKKISSMKIQLMSHNDHMWMEEFYSELKIQPKQSLLMQLVKFNNFLSRKAISTDLSKLIPDLGLSSGGSKLLQYVESSNILDICSTSSMALFYA
uniref:Peptidase M13 N-terminal domain-containing protein n=1 Tax=Trichobilharzia regenti TaxID=157069 RepID=A0AA85K660_TRIRE|nr:unnamed protein product [Trichobilharzia regenti]